MPIMMLLKMSKRKLKEELKPLKRLLENVEIIKDIPKDKVGLGSTVGIKYVDDPDDIR